ncbi:MAG TPA: tRNA (guanosine(18)-2'-O)-methyltransferase TrmH [Thermoanaerobaculia bacterium]|jgi:tRNA (guanosine-2'-O-)-methyltransferase|nr:tRNA (guanosine(18)-2'-O)-methyltransferase TrmH [Thermoanaerobaculia bacterium]
MSTPERFHRLRAVLDRRQPDLTVLLEDVQVPRNLAAILRSCDAVGVLEAHAVWPGGRLKISRPASGGNRKWLPVRKHRTLAAALEQLKDRGLRVLAAHPTPAAIPFREVDFTLPTALLLGNEDDGLTPEALAGAGAVVAIPMEGMGTSLNVSVAAALLLFEAQRQRRAAGLYDAPRLDPETHARLLFEWTWPGIAAQCRKRGAPYPPLGADGEILGPVPR